MKRLPSAVEWIFIVLLAGIPLAWFVLATAGAGMLGVLPVMLWSDRLMFLLVGVILLYFLYARRQPHLLVPWRRVTQSAYGTSALLVLIVFVVVGLVDSLHYRTALTAREGQEGAAYSTQALSLLDALATPLRTRSERTYSEPLATRAYARETMDITAADGTVRQVREFPRLAYGGAHLRDENERGRDIAIRVLRGLVWAFIAWSGLTALATAILARLAGRAFGAQWRSIWRRETATPWHVIFATAGVLLVLAFFASSLCTHYHLLGTDKVGRDVFYLSLKSIRTGLMIGTLTTLVVLPLALVLGTLAGYYRGWVDDVIQYVYTTINSIPGVLLIAAAVLLMQVYIDSNPQLFPTAAQRADLRLLFLCAILGLTGWTGLARLLRAETMKLRELDFVQAAQAFGVGGARVLSRHIFPNVMHIVVISLVLDFSGLVLAEAVLSYVGVGVDPTMTSFGTMINQARLEMSREPMVWWSLAAAFAFMFALVLSANLFADAVRDAFDPRVRMGSRLATAVPAPR
jgi:peptide/nickel transport system permease protein